MPLMASIWCEAYLPWLSSMSAKSGRSTFTESHIITRYIGTVTRNTAASHGLYTIIRAMAPATVSSESRPPTPYWTANWRTCRAPSSRRWMSPVRRLLK